jgi:oligopeptide transport system substrate-binding protein
MKAFKNIALTSISALLAFGLFACGGTTTEEEANPGGPVAGVPQELQLLIFDNRWHSLDPAASRLPSDWQVVSHYNEGLFRIYPDEQGNDKLEPAGILSYNVSDDDLVYTFKLRDYNWEDGVPVSAQHFVDAFIRVLDPIEAFTYSNAAFDILNAEKYLLGEVTADQVGVKALDEKTLEITLERPTPYFINKIAIPVFSPIRLDIIAQSSEPWGSTAQTTFSSGPFKVTEWIPENIVVLEKNPAYWDAENVKLDKVTLLSVQESSTRAQLFETGQLDAVTDKSEYVNEWLRRADAGEIEFFERYNARGDFIAVNNPGGVSGLMSNAKVRGALSLAVNRDELVELAYNGLQVPAYGLYPTGLGLNGEEARSLISEPLRPLSETYTEDPAALQELFQEGLDELGYSGTFDSITLSYISQNTDESNKILEQYLVQSWEQKLGIHVKLETIADYGQFYTRVDEGNYDLMSGTNSTDYNDPLCWADYWTTGSGSNAYYGQYYSEEYDKAVASLKGLSDIEKRTQIYADAERLVVAEDFGYIPLNYTKLEFFVQSNLHEFYVLSLSYPYEFSRSYKTT